jgi:hypothetical protein
MFGMKGIKSIVTPFTPHFKLFSKQSPTIAEDKASTISEDKAYVKCVFYTSAVGSLMYAMLCTLSNISQVVSVVSRFLPNPVKEYCEVVEWILRYLKGTIDICLSFGGDTCPLHDFVESNYVGDIDRRRSNIGYLFKIYGVLVNCRSMLEATLVLSTTKAEYKAITEGVKEALWLRGLLNDLGIKQEYVDLSYDNQSAIHLAKN